MTVPEETAREVQDWTCTFLERKNQNQKSAGSGGVFFTSKEKGRQKMEWHYCTVKRGQLRSLNSNLEAQVSQPGAHLANKHPLQATQGASQWARGELERLFLLREHFGHDEKFTPPGKFLPATCLPSRKLRTIKEKGGKKKKKGTSRDKMRKEVPKGHLQEEILFGFLYYGFFFFSPPLATLFFAHPDFH